MSENQGGQIVDSRLAEIWAEIDALQDDVDRAFEIGMLRGKQILKEDE